MDFLIQMVLAAIGHALGASGAVRLRRDTTPRDKPADVDPTMSDEEIAEATERLNEFFAKWSDFR